MGSLLLLLGGCAALLGLWPRPQDPRDRPYRIEAVRFAGGAESVVLAGEFTRPEGNGPFPAVVLITGSGPHDRNETIAGHRPFLVLSDHLTRSGFAVLRYDDRGVGESSGDFAAATPTDFADDAAAAFRWLTSRGDIDRTAIGYIGHSEGGYIAPLAAQRSPASFMVFLAGPAKPLLPDVMTTQVREIARSRGAPDTKTAKTLRQLARVAEILRTTDTVPQAKTELTGYLTGLGASRAQLRQNLELYATAWWQFYADYDPLPALEAFPGPVLALFGGSDLQVSAAENAPVMKRTLRHPQSEVVVFPDLNHLFQPSAGGRVEDYWKIDTTIDPPVLGKISDWLKAR